MFKARGATEIRGLFHVGHRAEIRWHDVGLSHRLAHRHHDVNQAQDQHEPADALSIRCRSRRQHVGKQASRDEVFDEHRRPACPNADLRKYAAGGHGQDEAQRDACLAEQRVEHAPALPAFFERKKCRHQNEVGGRVEFDQRVAARHVVVDAADIQQAGRNKELQRDGDRSPADGGRPALINCHRRRLARGRGRHSQS